MATQQSAQVAIPPGITAEDLRAAYALAQLRPLGIEYERAMATPSIAKAIIGTAVERKTHKMAPRRAAPAGQLKLIEG